MDGLVKKFSIYELFSLLALIISVLAERAGIFGNSNMGTIIMLNVLQSIVIAVAIEMSGYLRLRLGDYIVIATIMFVIQSLSCTTIPYTAIMLGGLWVIINVIVYYRYKNITRHSLECFLSYLVGIVGYVLFDNLYQKGFNKLYDQIRSSYQVNKEIKAIALIGITLVILMIIWIILLGIKLILHKFISQLGEISSKYEEISKYILVLPWILVLISFISARFEYMFFYINSPRMIRYYTWLFIGIVLTMQLLYIRMLIKTIQLKEHLAKEEMQKDTLREYSSNLLKNMQEIREIKHDIKNVFLTMGEYVIKSGDEEFIDYYKEKIVPFASQELKMNDLYVELQSIQNEPLRAFFYYKMMQGVDSGVDIHISANMNAHVLNHQNNFADITRVLGIFIDNAIEEAIHTTDRKVELSGREDDKNISFTVKNSVRKEMQARGIVTGTTTKGLGRGQGLRIAEKIIKKYDNILWNSYFTDDRYVQIITIELS